MQSTVKCDIHECARVHYGLGYCRLHYRRFKAHGNPHYVTPRKSVEERFWEKVDKDGPGGCWVWLAAKDQHGYGRFSVTKGESNWGAHRYAFLAVNGHLPDGLPLDHLCRNPSCVNPEHLEPVSQRVNMERGELPWAVMQRTNRCKVGHDLIEHGEWYVKNGIDYRRCRACVRISEIARKRRALEQNAGVDLSDLVHPR